MLNSELSNLYSVYVNEKKIYVYNVQVSAYPVNQVWPGYQRPAQQTELAAAASFDMEKPMKITVKSAKKINTALIKPSSFNIRADIIDDYTISFQLEGVCSVSVEINGRHSCLHLFANKPHKYDVENAICFESGVHDIGLLELKSGQTVYIAEDTIVYGRIIAKDAENITICGRGILCGSKQEERGSLIILERCKNVRLEGVMLRDPNGWTALIANCSDVIAKKLKLVGMWRYNADGIDVVNSNNIKISDCFIRTFDDCIAIKGMKRFESQNTFDVEVFNCILWCDWGRALEIGAETCCREIKNIHFHDCRIIRTADVAMDIQHTDSSLISNVIFENITVEADEFSYRPYLQKTKDELYKINHDDCYMPQLIVLEIVENMWARDTDRGNIKNVVFKNITAPSEMKSRLSGYDGTHMIEDVVISNLVVSGKKVDNFDDISVNEYVKNVRFE